MEILGASATYDEAGIRMVSRVYLVDSISAGLGMGDKGKKTVQVSQDESGKFIAVVTGPENENETELPPPTFSMSSGFEEEAIEAHPKIGQLMKQYGGYWEDGRVMFPPTVSGGGGGGSLSLGGGGGLGGGEDSEKPNPMFGVDKYKKVAAVFTITRFSRDRPGNLLSGAGRIGSPEGAPGAPSRMAWMRLPGKFSFRAGLYEVTEEYMLVDRSVPGVYADA